MQMRVHAAAPPMSDSAVVKDAAANAWLNGVVSLWKDIFVVAWMEGKHGEEGETGFVQIGQIDGKQHILDKVLWPFGLYMLSENGRLAGAAIFLALAMGGCVFTLDISVCPNLHGADFLKLVL